MSYGYAVHPGRTTEAEPLEEGTTDTLNASCAAATAAVLAAARARDAELLGLGDLLGDLESERGAVKTFRFTNDDRVTAHVWRDASGDYEQKENDRGDR